MPFPTPHQTVETLKNIGMLGNPNIAPNPSQIEELRSALREDAESYLYNGITSFGSAIHSISVKNYGWAIVKFYYSVFYLARSKLATNQLAIVYDGTKPYLLSLSSPTYLKKQEGNTHKLVLKLLKEHIPSHSLSIYGIGTENKPTTLIDWLMKQREIANYKSAVDEEHACLAYPFLFLLEMLKEFEVKGYSCDFLKDNFNFIKSLLREKDENLDVILSVIRSCCEVS